MYRRHIANIRQSEWEKDERVAQLNKIDPHCELLPSRQELRASHPPPPTLGSLPQEIVTLIAKCMDTPTLSWFTQTCQSLHSCLMPILDNREEIITAVRQHKEEDVRRLLAAGADPDARFFGRPIFHIAIAVTASFHHFRAEDETFFDSVRYATRDRRELPEVATILVESGCDTNARDENGCTALYLAAASDDVDRVKLLLKIADPNVASTEMAWTPLHRAAYGSNIEISELLLHRADPTQQDATGATALHIARRHGRAVGMNLDYMGAYNIMDFLGLRPRDYYCGCFLMYRELICEHNEASQNRVAVHGIVECEIGIEGGRPRFRVGTPADIYIPEGSDILRRLLQQST